jgi:hypothetical protein
MRIPVIVVLLVVGVSADVAIPCGTARPQPNLCATATSSSTKRPTPFCVRAAAQYQCAACAQNCDCPWNTYCIKSPTDPDVGTCRALTRDSMLGKPCIRHDFPEDGPTAVLPVAGVDELLICGRALFATNGTFVRWEWKGECVEGVCQLCDGGPFDTALAGVLAKGGHGPDGSLVCPSSWCVSGRLVPQLAWWARLGSGDGATTGLLIIVVLVVSTYLFFKVLQCTCRRCCRRRSANRFTNILDELPGGMPASSETVVVPNPKKVQKPVSDTTDTLTNKHLAVVLDDDSDNVSSSLRQRP